MPSPNPKNKSWKDDTVDLVNKALRAKTQTKREDAVGELIDYIEDLVLIAYTRGRENGQKLVIEAMSYDDSQEE